MRRNLASSDQQLLNQNFLFLSKLIDAINADECASLQPIFDSQPSTLHLTTMFYNEALTSVKHIVFGIHGFLVTNKELEPLAEKTVTEHPDTVFIAFNIPGFHTLKLVETRELCKANIICGRLETIYHELVDFSTRQSIPLSVHGNSFGAQLLLDTVWNHYSKTNFLPVGISLLSPFLMPTTAINMLLPMVLSIVALEERLFPAGARLLTAALNFLMGDQRYTEDGVFMLTANNRGTPKVKQVPASAYMTLRSMTREFYTKITAAEGLPKVMRERIHVTMSSCDPIIGGATAMAFIKDYIVLPNQLSHSAEVFHVVDDEAKMPLITSPSAAVREHHQTPSQITCLRIHLTIFRKTSPITQPSASAAANATL